MRFNGAKSQQEAVWNYVGAMQGQSEMALKMIKQRRYRECFKHLSIIEDYTREFEALPMRADLPHFSTPATGGLPAGDKD